MDKDKLYIQHILDSIKSIQEYTENINKEQFLAKENKDNKMIRAAVIREFEVIGEAVKKLSEEIKKSNSDLPWLEISNMRNKLIHEYFGVNFKIVWSAIENDLPILKQAMSELLRSF